MVNPFKEVNWRPNLRERRKFALSLLIGCPVVAALMLTTNSLRGSWNPHPPLTLAAIGVGVGTFLWLFPRLALPFYFVVYGVTCSIGIVVSNTLLIVFFYSVITLAAFGLKLLGRVPLRKRPDPGVKSYWKPLDPVKDITQYYRQY
ncbi:MAG: hypothetical protein JWM99_4315 [Verrucomicrobiales bacterium]|nr:hypothetical protein [Verrucomicrobiales bacterium]